MANSTDFDPEDAAPYGPSEEEIAQMLASSPEERAATQAMVLREPFLQADWPTASRLSQTLGHAKSLIMEEPLSFIAPLAHSRTTQVSAGASSTARLLKGATEVGSGCPSFGGQRTVASDRKQEELDLSKPLSLSIKVPSFEFASWHLPRRPCFFSQYPSTGSVQAQLKQLAHPALVCSVIRIQGMAAAHRAWPNPSFKRTCLRQAA